MSEKVTAQMVNDLRARTGAGILDCKKALNSTGGDVAKAIDLLKEKGVATAAKKAGREASEGLIESYIHLSGKVGVIVELNCETDFVAKNEEFKQLAKDICMHVAAVAPTHLNRDEVPEELVSKEKAAVEAQAAGKPQNAIESIVKGKLDKWFAQFCLMDQTFVKNGEQTIRELLTEKISKLGENIVISRFCRFQIGE